MGSKLLRVYIYHAAKSNKMKQEIVKALAKRLANVIVLMEKPEDADVVYGVYLSDDGRHRVLRKLGAQ